MGNEFNFQLQTQLFYGFGFCRKLDEFLKKLGFQKSALLVDEGVAKSIYYQDVLERIIQRYPNIVITRLRGTEEPDYDYLDEIADKIRRIEKLNVIVGIGGGSTLDIAKAVAVLRTNPGKGTKYRGFDQVRNPGVPTVIIPTTAGTASEVTINAVFIDKKEMRKMGINGKYMNATYAILDAEWTLSCPRFVAVSAGMDAMVHALESFMNRKTNHVTRMFSREAFRILYKNLPTLVEEPENQEKRQQLLLGSYFAGIALFNSGPGIAGAMSYPIGVHYKVPHGIGGAIFINSVVAFNVERGYYEYAELLDSIEFHPDMSLEEKSEKFIETLRELSEKLKVPKYLDDWGITKKNVEEVSKLMIPMRPVFDQNPIAFSVPKDALAILKQHVAP